MPDLGQTSALPIGAPASHLFLLDDLVLDLGLLVELVEGVHDDGDGQGYDQHSTDGAGSTAQFSEPSSEKFKSERRVKVFVSFTQDLWRLTRQAELEVF